MTLALPSVDHEHQTALKDYLIFRVDELEGSRELSDESALEAEATRYARLMALADAEAGIHYEVHAAQNGGLLHTTAEDGSDHREAPWIQTVTL